MANGFGLLGGNSSTQSAVVVGWPNHDSLYIVFTVAEAAGPDGFNYSVVNMNLQGRLGELVVKNIPLYAPSCEKITAILHDNGQDIWIITHKWLSNEFYCYLVTDQGVQTAPRIQAIGNTHLGPVTGLNYAGYMKASPSGNKIALILRDDAIAQLFDFDNKTGHLSNPLTLDPHLGSAYGTEFSPDGNFLYVGFRDSLFLDNYVYQYDVNINSQVFINQAAILIKYLPRSSVLQPSIGGLQLTPDGRIFVTTGFPFLSSIEHPNISGIGCSFVDTIITLAGRRSKLGLPTFNQSYFRPISIGARNTCIGDSANIFLTDTIGVDSVHWAFGDTASGGSNTSSNFFPQHLYAQGGNFTIQAIYYADTLIDTLTKEIQVVVHPTVSLPGDTTVCADSLLIQAQSPQQNYFWSTSSMDSLISVNASGLFWVEVNNACGRIRDSILVTFDTLVQVQLPASHVLCSGDSLLLTGGPVAKAAYLWQDSLMVSSRYVKDAGWNWLQASNTCGTTRDSIWINIEQVPTVFLGNDTVLCQGDSLPVDARFSRSTYLWQDGRSTPRRVLRTSGLYQVNITNLCGIGYDEIRVRFDSLQVPDLPADTLLCIGDSLLLDGSILGPAIYLWQDGLSQASRKIADIGRYRVTASNACGSAVDSIWVDSLSSPTISLGVDTTFCHGDTLWLDISYRAASYLWSHPNQGPRFAIDTTGLYWGLSSNHCGYDVDSIYVITDLPQTVKLGDDTTIVCGNDSLLLDARSQGQANYLWFNGSTAPTLSVINPGIYWAQASNVCGISTDTILVERVGYPQVSLPADTMFCEGDSLNLQVFAQMDVVFQWQDGSGNLGYTVKDSGFYWVEARRAVCIRSDSIWVDVDPYPLIELGEDSILCAGDSLILQLPRQNQVQYLWPDSSQNLSYLINAPGTYKLKAWRSVCRVEDSINIQYVDYPIIELGADTTLCEGEILTLQVAPQNDVVYRWPDGSGQLSYQVSTPEKVLLLANRFHCQHTDSIHVSFDPYPQVDLGADTILCEGANLNLNAFFPDARYIWSDGSSLPNLLVQQAGTYAVTLSNDCSEASDMIRVEYEVPPTVDLGPDTILCEGELLALDASFSRANYQWQDGSIGPNFLVDQQGTYSVWVQNLCGEAEDEIDVKYEDVPALSLGTDTLLCVDDILYLDVFAPNSTFLWQDGSTRPGYEVRESGLYQVQLSHRCGMVTDSIAVSYQHCDCKFFLANAFSPNGDGRNDHFGPSFACTYSDYHLQLFNRWGQLIFESHDPTEQWDGSFKGKSVPEGVYVWRLKYQSALEYRAVERRGSVTVLR